MPLLHPHTTHPHPPPPHSWNVSRRNFGQHFLRKSRQQLGHATQPVGNVCLWLVLFSVSFRRFASPINVSMERSGSLRRNQVTGNTPISILLLCFPYLFVGLMITTNESNFVWTNQITGKEEFWLTDMFFFPHCFSVLLRFSCWTSGTYRDLFIIC